MALTSVELCRLREACDNLEDGPNYRCKDYVTNMLNTALDFQMHSTVVSSSIEYFSLAHGAKTHRKLKSVIEGFPNTKRGNKKLANHLWNNNHWTRAKFLRKILTCFEERGVKGQKSLEIWVKEAEYEVDVKGQFKTEEHSIGFALFQWLRLRCGLNTVKPDVYILRFVNKAVGRKVSQQEAVVALKKVARDSRRRANRLDAAIWHYEKELGK